MSARFVSASSTYLSSGSFIPTYPFTVALKVFPTTTGSNKVFWSVGAFGANDYWVLQQASSNVWQILSARSTVQTSSAGTVTANQWAFLVGRFISATNRRLSVLDYNGAVSHVQNTTSSNPQLLDNMGLGCRASGTKTLFFDGNIAEYWITDTDIQPGGTQLLDTTLRQLAWGGPFSWPLVAKDLVEYRGLVTAIESRSDRAGDVYFGKFGRLTWDNNNGVAIGAHCPLPYWYVKPGQTRRFLMA